MVAAVATAGTCEEEAAENLMAVVEEEAAIAAWLEPVVQSNTIHYYIASG